MNLCRTKSIVSLAAVHGQLYAAMVFASLKVTLSMNSRMVLRIRKRRAWSTLLGHAPWHQDCLEIATPRISIPSKPMTTTATIEPTAKFEPDRVSSAFLLSSLPSATFGNVLAED